MDLLNPLKNFEETREKIGYVDRKDASQADYDRIGFMSGLEVHQQILTRKKLFCHCPAGIFQKPDQFDAEIIRHMRPTLSELGEYDGTALMEFRTRKTIIYHLANKNACTYEVDDTPPFPINREALEKAIGLALASKLNIVGEVHITRKQYLDGSIPTGFQRTAIIGIEGSIRLRNKEVRLIQLSLEEDSCREVSDIGHTRVYRTDRLGMPLIETVTYPDFANPEEVKEGCDYIRFLNRSTGLVRTGMGAGRQDVNVSCRGGSRVEIKGVAHTRWIPELTHVEAFRQWALLAIRDELKRRVQPESWKMDWKEISPKEFHFYYPPIQDALEQGEQLVAVNLPGFAGLLSHFAQPGKPFYDEFSSRLKVIACVEKPNMATSEDIEDVVSRHVFDQLSRHFNATEQDAQILFWAPRNDVPTALEVIRERAAMAFEGVPLETRKSFEDGTTIFERVLPGADRMYPDTDSAPIPLDSNYIESLRSHIPEEISERYARLREWGVPEDTYTYLFSKNLYPIILRIIEDLDVDPLFTCTLFGHRLKHLHGQCHGIPFEPERIYEMLQYLKEHHIDLNIAPKMLMEMFKHPKMDMESMLTMLNYKKIHREEIISQIAGLKEKFNPLHKNRKLNDLVNNIMGELRQISEGNMNLTELANLIKE